MKKCLIFVLLICLSCFILTGCDEEDSPTNNTDVPGEAAAAPKIKGEVFKTDDFEVIIADGFKKMDIDGGVQAYKSKDVVEIWVRGSGLDDAIAKSSCESLANRQKGSECQKIVKFGMDFYVTSFEAFGTPQTVYTAVKNGKKIQIGISGKDHENNETLQGMFESISFK